MNVEIQAKEFIFSEGRPFQSCHASTLVKLPGGDLLAAWFGGSREGQADVAIWCSRRVKGQWTEPVKVSDEDGIPHWNPVLFLAPDDQVWLFYKIGHQIPTWQTRIITSPDGGIQWTKSRPLMEGGVGGRGPVKNKPIVLSNGHWLAPASHEGEQWNAFVDESPDEGRTWIRSPFVPLRRWISGELSQPGDILGKGVIQPTLWESSPGKVHMLLRSTEGAIFRSDSTDGGKNWCIAYPTLLPNNNSGIDLVKMESGLLALVYNPVEKNWGKRTPLVVSLSEDNGLTWRQACVLEDDPGEYSYPAVIADREGLLITYTWKRRRIVFTRINLLSMIGKSK